MDGNVQTTVINGLAFIVVTSFFFFLESRGDAEELGGPATEGER